MPAMATITAELAYSFAGMARSYGENINHGMPSPAQ